MKPYLILMDPEAPYTKNFILVWIEMKICKPLENCLGLEMIWKLSFNSKRNSDKVTLVLDMNPMKICVKALSSLSLYKQIRLLGMWHMLMRAMVIMSTKSKIFPLNWTHLRLYKHCIFGWKIPIMGDVQLWRNSWHNNMLLWFQWYTNAIEMWREVQRMNPLKFYFYDL